MRLLGATLSAFLIALPAVSAERVDLAGSGQQDFFSLNWSAVGADAADPLVRGCPGFAEGAPAIEANLATPGDLHLYLAGEGLSGVLVVRPDGLNVCETPNKYGYAALNFTDGGAGVWSIRPLAAAAGAEISGSAVVSSTAGGPRDVVRIMGLTVDHDILPPLLSDVPLDPLAPPAFGDVAFPADGDVSLSLTMEGRVPADEAGSECRGLIDQTRPDVRLSLAADEPVLAIAAASDADSTLLVVTPAGDVYCSDDAVGRDPALAFENAAAGDYAVWVGVYAGGEGQAATLTVGRTSAVDAASSSGGDATGDTLGLDAAPAYGSYGGPSGGGSIEIGISTAGGDLASSYDGACSGEIDGSRPDLVVSVSEPGPLWVAARSDAADTTLLVVAPDGAIQCNDDYEGTAPAVAFDPASPGDYSIWVGVWNGAVDTPATLILSQTPPGGDQSAAPSSSSSSGPDLNPFIGRDLPSAMAALEVMREDPAFAATVSWTEVEETGPEGFILHGVTVADPTGQESPVSIERIAVSELDLAGLSATGAPERFAISIEGADYAAIARAAQAGGPPLPDLAEDTPLSISASLLPSDGDESRRDIDVALSLDGQIGIGFSARMLWPEDALAMGPEMAAAMAEVEAIEVTLTDMGYLSTALNAMAAQGGGQPEELTAMALAELEGALGAFGPFSPGSPRGQLFAAISARLADLDAPGEIRIRLSAPQALDAETAFGALMADEIDPSVVSVEIEHAPR